MLKKYIFIPALLLFAGICFYIINFLIFITKGKYSFLIKNKLKIGSFIIALQLLISGNVYSDGGQPTCYEVAVVYIIEYMYNDQYIYYGEEIEINLKENNIITYFTYESNLDICYLIKDENNNTVQSGPITVPEDNKSGIEINSNLSPGIYCFYTYNYPLDTILKDEFLEEDYLYSFRINIKE